MLSVDLYVGPLSTIISSKAEGYKSSNLFLRLTRLLNESHVFTLSIYSRIKLTGSYLQTHLQSGTQYHRDDKDTKTAYL